MQKHLVFISGLSAALLFVLVGTASAEVGTEAGNWQYEFNSPQSTAEVAAENYQYDQEALARVGTEAGNWQYDFDAPVTKAERAAQNYQYDQESLARVGTEAGDWQFNPTLSISSDEAIASDAEPAEAICKEC